MGLGSCLTCIKWLLFAFNFLFWLIGCVMIALGVWMIVDPSSLADINIVQELPVGTYGLIAIGSIIMLVGFFGCCGAIRESQCLLATFFFSLFLIFIALLGIGVFYIINPESSQKYTEKAYKLAAEKYYDEDEKIKNDAKHLIDSFHKRFDCCGHSKGADDFKMLDLPPGCPNPVSALVTKKRLCPEAFAEAVKKGSVVIAGVALGVGVILLIGMIFAMMLCCAIRDSKEQ